MPPPNIPQMPAPYQPQDPGQVAKNAAASGGGLPSWLQWLAPNTAAINATVSNGYEGGVDLGPLGVVGDPSNVAYGKLQASRMPSDIAGADAYEAAIRSGLAQGPRGNPYSVMAGNQSRDALEQALEHLHTGTSTIAGQAGRAMGALGQAGAAQVADAGGGLGAMRAAGGVASNASGIANQAGQGRLQEWMAQQNDYGQGLGALRGQDRSQQQAYTNSGLQAQGQDNALQQFYLNLGSNLQDARNRAGLEWYKAYQNANMGQQKNNQNAAQGGAQAVGTIAKVMG